MADLNERVAVLEAQFKAFELSNAEVLAELRAMRGDYQRYKGFLGGVTFLGGCLVTFLTVGKDWLLSHWK